MTAEQFAGEQIIAIGAVASLWVLLRSQHLLNLKVQFVTDNPRYSALDANIAIDVDATVSLVGKYLLETGPPPRATI